MQSIGHSVVVNSSQHELYSTNGYRFANVLNWFLSFVLWPSGRRLVNVKCELENLSDNAKSMVYTICYKRINVKWIQILQIHKIKYKKNNIIGHEMPEDSHTFPLPYFIRISFSLILKRNEIQYVSNAAS